MKRFVFVLSAVLGITTACSTTQSTANKVADMETRPNATYCIIEANGGATALTNRLALDAFYQTRSLPTCELLYRSYYDFQAPTAMQRVNDLHRRIEMLEEELNSEQ